MSQDPNALPRLGSLAQAARGKHLRQARIALIAVGILTIIGNIALFFLAESAIEEAIRRELSKAGPGMEIDHAKVNEFKAEQVRTAKLVAGGTVVLGVVFIALGVLVNRFPVPATVTGLVLYIGANVIFALLYPDSVRGGWWLKIIIVIVLVKSLQAAIAYQKEQQAANPAAEYGV